VKRDRGYHRDLPCSSSLEEPELPSSHEWLLFPFEVKLLAGLFTEFLPLLLPDISVVPFSNIAGILTAKRKRAWRTWVRWLLAIAKLTQLNCSDLKQIMNERQELDRLLPEQFRPHSVPICAFRMSKKGEELIIKPHSECVHLVYKRLSNYSKLSTLCSLSILFITSEKWHSFLWSRSSALYPSWLK